MKTGKKWILPSNHNIFSNSHASMSFDGKHFYKDGAYSLDSYGENDEWNQSGHGPTSTKILGPYAYVSMDCERNIIFLHAIYK